MILQNKYLKLSSNYSTKKKKKKKTNSAYIRPLIA